VLDGALSVDVKGLTVTSAGYLPGVNDQDGSPPAPSDNTTMTSVLDAYRRDGFAEDFVLEETAVRCGACGAASPVADIEVHSLRRLEGASDPADMAAVLALRCPACQAKGVAVAKYGPEASEAEAQLLLTARDHRFTGTSAPAATATSETD
jgi:hypothetical protein